MTLILRIYFVGMMAFAPSPDGKEMTVFFVNARDGYFLSDGTEMKPHVPMMIVRSQNCAGDCIGSDFQRLADFIYARGRVDDPMENQQQFRNAIGGGGAWELRDSQLSIRVAGRGDSRAFLSVYESDRSVEGEPVPRTLGEAQSFRWVADMNRIKPDSGYIDPDAVSDRPQKNLIAARITLNAGTIKTHSLVQKGNRIVPAIFRPLLSRAGERGSPKSAYSQAIAETVMVEIPINGCQVTLSEEGFFGGEDRDMTLSKKDCKKDEVIEIVMANLPAASFGPGAQQESGAAIGKHFELFYELAKYRPPNRRRPVPELDFTREQSLPPAQERSMDGNSRLLRALGWEARTIYGPPICPVARFHLED